MPGSKTHANRAAGHSATLSAAVALAIATIATPLHAAARADRPYVKGQILVAPNAGLLDDEFDKIVGQRGARSVRKIESLNVHVVEVPEQAEEAVALALSRNPHIKFAELDTIWELSETLPNDPNYGGAWHLPKISATMAWDTTAGAGVTVAILDTGVDAAHPDLAGQLVPGWNVASNTADTSDVYGHGTQVAGTVGAITNNCIGVASVAGNTQLMPIRISNDATSGTASTSVIASGLTWAADHGADVANVSYGVVGNATVSSAAQYMRTKGGVVVVAAGNSGTNLSYADDPSIIAVSATDSADQKASWSNYGSFVDVSAPGVGIWSTVRGGSYAAVSGTSFASPVTAGVVALIRSANPNLGPAETETVLEQSAVDPVAGSDYHVYFGWGRVNADAAVQLALQTTAADTQAPVATIFAPTTGSTVKGLTTVNVDASDNVGVTQVALYAGSTLIGTDASAPYAFSWDTSGLGDGNVTLVARAYDSAQNVGASASVVVAVDNVPNVGDTVAPTVSFSTPAAGSTVSGKINVLAKAQDNVAVSQIALYVDGKLLTSNSGSTTLSYTWNTKSASKGAHTLRVVATDTAGNQNQTSIQVTVK